MHTRHPAPLVCGFSFSSFPFFSRDFLPYNKGLCGETQGEINDTFLGLDKEEAEVTEEEERKEDGEEKEEAREKKEREREEEEGKRRRRWGRGGGWGGERCDMTGLLISRSRKVTRGREGNGTEARSRERERTETRKGRDASYILRNRRSGATRTLRNTHNKHLEIPAFVLNIRGAKNGGRQYFER